MTPETPTDRFARATLVLLAFTLPFETPLFRLGPLDITSVELAMYLSLAAWGLSVTPGALRALASWAALRGVVAGLWRDPLVRAVLLGASVMVISALTAPSHRGAAIKFALRSLGGILIFFAAREHAASPGAVRRIGRALAAGALLAAASCIVEARIPASGAVWQLFRDRTFDTLGLPRASGVFGYPTIGAMYWEASVPLLVAIPLLARRDVPASRAWRGPLLTVLGTALLVGAILASGTRSGLMGSLIAAGAMLALWPGAIVRRAAGGALAVAALLPAVVVLSASQSLLAQRLRFWNDAEWYRVEYTVDASRIVARPGEVFRVPVTMRNTGTVTWRKDGPNPTHLSYHWVRPGAPMTHADFEGRRTALVADVPPGESIRVAGVAQAPHDTGRFKLRWDLVHERITWFSERGNPTAEQDVEVMTAPGQRVPRSPALDDARPHVPGAPDPPSRPALWRAAVILWLERPLFGVGPDNYRRRYPAVLSPAPNGQPYTDTRIHANNLYFETLADTGIAGLAALFLLAIALARLVRAHRAAGRLAGFSCGMAAATFFVHGATDYFFEFTPLYGLFWLLLGVTAAQKRAPPLK
jgi:hypothetical protein